MTEAAVQPQLSTRRSLTRLWPYARPYRLRLAASTVLATAASCLALVMPLVLKWIVDGPIAHRQPAGVLLGGLALLVLGAAEAGIFGVRRWLAAGPLALIEATMRADFHRHVQRLPMYIHDRWPKGQILSRGTTDLQVVRSFLAGPMTFVVVNSMTILAGGAILISQQWLLGLIVLATVPVLIYVSTRFETRYGAATRAAQDISGDLTTTVGESILAIRVIKGFRQDRAQIAGFRQQVRTSREAEIGKAALLGTYSAVIMTLPDLATACALAIGAVQVAHGHLSTGSLVAFLATIIALRPSVAETGSLLASSHDAAASAARFFEVLDEPEAPQDEPEAPQDKVRAPQHPRTREPAELAVEGVWFRYPGTAPEHPPVLRDVSLRIARGETLAVVGTTGSGKTTLAALVARVYNPVKGRITLDGVDIATLSAAQLCEAVAVAFDQPTLFSTSAADNVLMGLDAGQVALEEALQIAHAQDFVSQLPDGARTQLSENGLTLSGGQRQRIALARAVIRKPRLLVLDDPLSALDIHTEAQVQEALREVLATTTALIIAHRPSTVQLADRVAVLGCGQIVAIGTHDKLLETSPEYVTLMTTVESAVMSSGGRET
ncbi:MAG TPA: ABC transporter ATP-binding protein [Streptosporangiaceae bacterium]|jgi:ATP-binding cassette subfamily B protein